MCSYNKVAASKKDPYGKLFFAGVPLSMDQYFYVGQVTPVVHYTMGGLAVNADTAVLTAAAKPIPGLFATGEVCYDVLCFLPVNILLFFDNNKVMGGVHGVNRLGGSSLLDCVVFGRVAGANATATLMQRALKGIVNT
jgi:succinate dehydrogenase/fumarate reductase flavoprotein subunit